jgi:hypothetical protein
MGSVTKDRAPNIAAFPAAIDRDEPDGRLKRLGREFKVLRDRLESANRQRRIVSDAPGGFDPEQEAAQERHADSVMDALYQLEWEVAETRATTLDGLKVKGQALLEFCEPDPCDITHSLAASLSNDLIELELADVSTRSLDRSVG